MIVLISKALIQSKKIQSHIRGCPLFTLTFFCIIIFFCYLNFCL